MRDAVENLNKVLATYRKPVLGLGGRIQHVAIQHHLGSLIEHLENIESGHFIVTDSTELVEVILTFLSESESTRWSLMIGHPALARFAPRIRRRVVSMLSDLFRADMTGLSGTMIVHCSTLRDLLKDATLLRLTLQASSHGLLVQAIANGSLSAAPCAVDLSSASGRLMANANSLDSSVLSWSVDVHPKRVSVEEERTASGTAFRVISLAVRSDDVGQMPSDSVCLAVRDIFGEFICLRDLEPDARELPGFASLRNDPGITQSQVPRKTESAYAEVVRSFVTHLAGPAAKILYVGDSLLTDGSVVCNLDALLPGSIAGFLCNEGGFGHPTDFVVGPIYFANRWRSLVHFLGHCSGKGISIDERLVALFDLDQTVYAAKGRNDRPLHEVRWEALHTFLLDTIPSYRLDSTRAEALYRKFDCDEYHAVTLDNLDYVVVLVLAAAAGLTEADELDALTSAPENNMSVLTRVLYERATARGTFEDLSKVTAALRAIHYNTITGDQTPCKEFRRYECQAMARHMRGGTSPSALVLNREVFDFVRVLRERGVHVLALSDRPLEATVIESDDLDDAEDILSIPMHVVGYPIYERLRQYA